MSDFILKTKYYYYYSANYYPVLG